MRVKATDGWTPELASRIKAPTLFMFGQFDDPARLKSFEQISAADKVLLRVACGSHFMVWEKPHRTLHAASREWLTMGSLKNVRRGELSVDDQGNFNTDTVSKR